MYLFPNPAPEEVREKEIDPWVKLPRVLLLGSA